MKIKIKFQQGDYKVVYKVKLSEKEKEKYKKNPVSYCFNKMTALLSTEYAFDWDKISHIEEAVYKQTLGKPLKTAVDPNHKLNLSITVEHKEDSQTIFCTSFDDEVATYWISYVRAFLSVYKVDYDI